MIVGFKMNGIGPIYFVIQSLCQSKVTSNKTTISTGDQAPAMVPGFKSNKGEDVAFTEPIEVALTRNGSIYQAEFEPLAITTHGANAKAALDAFDRELRLLYARYLINRKDREEEREGLRSEREGRIMTALEELL